MRKALIPFAISFLVLFSGCSAINTPLENLILKKSTIQEDAQYQEYSLLAETGQLAEDGTYLYTEPAEPEEANIVSHEGKVHVTFASNASLNITYFTDEQHTSPIDTEACYLTPGDTIYATVRILNGKSNLYSISEFRIYQYNDDGTKTELPAQPAEVGDVLVYRIPSDCTDTEFSILPVGEYSNRTLTLRAYLTDDAGKQSSLTGAGTWSLDDQPCNSDAVSLSLFESHLLKYTFDTGNYFYVSSSPAPFKHALSPNEAGYVEFEMLTADSADTNYEVELHTYLNLSVKVTAEAKLAVYDASDLRTPTNTYTIKKGKQWKSTDNNCKLKYGDRIIIETNGEYEILGGDYVHVKCTTESITNGSRYILDFTEEASTAQQNGVSINHTITLTLPDAGAHGQCSYKLDGKKVSGTVTLQESQKLTITYTITDSAYRFANSSILNFVQDFVGNPQKTVTVPLSGDMGSTLDPDSYFEIEKKSGD